MSDSPKIVYSKSLQSVDESPHWKDVEIARDIDADALAKAKEVDDRNFTILGSGSIVQQLTRPRPDRRLSTGGESGCPRIGKESLRGRRPELAGARRESRAFKNGLVWLRYESKRATVNRESLDLLRDRLVHGRTGALRSLR